MILDFPRLSRSAEELLFDEPRNSSDIRDVRHWIRVYTNLLELTVGLPPRDEQSASLRHRLDTWQERLGFWQTRAREVSNPSAAR
ncbi:MAG: hypothetical protein PVSMB9_02670 [Candidatus Dormibacteria bacterium]